MSNLDLSNILDIHAYLAEKHAFICTDIQTLSGGSGNFVFRLHLKTPYEGRSTLILKHAKAYVALSSWIPFALERQVRA